MFSISKWISLLVFFSSTSLFSAQYICLDPTNVIPVELSLNNHNRICITHDRIKKAFFNSGNIVVNVDEDTGQLFVQAIRPDCPSTTLSIVSTSGLIQELELNFHDGPSEIILLEPIANDIVTPCVDRSSLESLVSCVLQGQVPEDYHLVDDLDPCPPMRKGLRYQRISRLISDEQIVFIYKLQNITRCEKIIKECQVNILDGDWVFLDHYTLCPGEEAFLMIGCLR